MMTTYDAVKAQLLWMSAAMIPGDVLLGMPSARDVDLINAHLPNALKARPDLAPRFLDIVSTLPAESPADPLAAINAIPSSQMEVIARFMAGAYFAASEVSSALRFPGFEALYEEVDYDAIMAAIEPIVERGPVYVKV